MNTILSKLLPLVFFLTGLYGHTQAQDTTGQLEISLSGIPLYDFDQGYFGFVANPGFKYHLNDRVALGTNFFYFHINNIEASGVPARSRAYGAIPTIRYTLPSSSRVRVFAEGGVGFGAVVYKPEESANDNSFFPVSRNNGGLLVMSLGLGVEYVVSDKFSIEVMLPFIHAENITNDYIDEAIYQGVGLNGGLKYRVK